VTYHANYFQPKCNVFIRTYALSIKNIYFNNLTKTKHKKHVWDF